MSDTSFATDNDYSAETCDDGKDAFDIFPFLSDDVLTNVVEEMNTSGFGVVRGCINPEILMPAVRFIEERVAASGGEYVAFAGSDALAGTFLAGLSSSPSFRAACETLYRKGTGLRAPDTPFYQLLRCLSGGTGKQHSFYFHYDSYVLTVLLPIVIPSDGRAGDLVMIPNMRRLRKTYAGNLIDKVMLENRVVQKGLKIFVSSGWLPATRVRMIPGNAYFFWGYRSIHANEPCDPDRTRATALFHYVNPHAESVVRERLGRGWAAVRHGHARANGLWRQRV
ncbi:hypothetical protein [Acetobacter fallax]|uniref:hypothetical protein n=1 Tax=Acetobacter fallax TaxID=1737473 RepID=UPI00156AA383|nr:hypothetical protein [Acetobacter fallax]